MDVTENLVGIKVPMVGINGGLRGKKGRACDQKTKVGSKHDKRAFLGLFFEVHGKRHDLKSTDKIPSDHQTKRIMQEGMPPHIERSRSICMSLIYRRKSTQD